MWPTVTDPVVWSVCLLVCHTSEHCKTAETIEMPFGLQTKVGPRKHASDGAQTTHAKGQLLGERTCWGMPDDSAVSCAKIAQPIYLPFTLWTRIGQRKHKFNRTCHVAVHQYAFMGGHIRATWRIRLNRPSSAVMHTYVNLLWTVVFCLHNDCSSVLFLSLSPFISILCHSDWLFHKRSCPRLDVVYPGRAWSSSPACTWHCSLHYFFLQAIPLFPHGVTIVC